MAYSDILYEKHDKVATITINRPHAMNSGTIRTWSEIGQAFGEAEHDASVHVVVITGAGRAFCAGDDVKEIFLNPEFRDAKPSKRAEVEEWRTHQPVALDFLVTYPKPTIASVNGAAVGYGCDIALMCDMRICSDQARFGEVFIRRGLIPEAGGLLVLPRLVGLARAYELILSGDIIDANEAERIGMVNKVVPHAQLGEARRRLLRKSRRRRPRAAPCQGSVAGRVESESAIFFRLSAPWTENDANLAGSFGGRQVVRREARREFQGRIVSS